MMLSAQSRFDKQSLEALSAEKQEKFRKDKDEAIRYANKNNFPVIIQTDNTYQEIRYISENGIPQYYVTHNKHAATTISTDKLHPGSGSGFNLEGSGMTIHLWDAGGVLESHQEFNDRIEQIDNPGSTHYHSTHVAGTMAAAGVKTDAKGMAPDAMVRAFDWDYDESEMASEAAAGAFVSNHSYGYARGWENGIWNGDPTVSTEEDYLFGFYNEFSKSWDQIAFNAPYYLIVKSAGNDRNDCGDGSYPCDGPFDCIGSLGVAKNVITIGAVTDLTGGYQQPSDVEMTVFSSWGPTDDGRIKPDIVANGLSLYSTDDDYDSDYRYLSGTSMSAPSVAGSLILLQEYYENLNGEDEFLRAATLKALVIHTADEAGQHPGPDYIFGWGLMNTRTAAEKIAEDTIRNVIDELELIEGSVFTRTVTATGWEPLKATIAWTDVPGEPPAIELDPYDVMLVNDLDMKIVGSEGDYFPWRLSRNNPESPAINNSDNDVDNVEMVVVPNPVPNEQYTIIIVHDQPLTGGEQAFSLILSGTQEPATLPFLEDWESQNGTRKTDGNIYTHATYSWDFETNKQNEGRTRWGSDAFMTYEGDGALTLDKFPNNGTYATNYVTLNINLAKYTGATDLELSFFWTDHNDEDYSEDKVWIRGSNEDEWIEVYDLNPGEMTDGNYNYVSGIDIDDALFFASPQQYVTPTFQVRFGQRDNSFAPGDGLSFDNIRIEGSSAIATLPFMEDWESESGSRKSDGSVYTSDYYQWEFQTDRQNEGRLRWGIDAYQVHNGQGAMTLDKHPNNGTYAVNCAILTLDLELYETNDNLELSFWWADHNDEDQPQDKIWIRGSETCSWVEAYDLNPADIPDGVYQYVSGIDIDSLLAIANPSQTVTETFQLKFGQRDNSFSPGDGLSFDDIVIEQTTGLSAGFRKPPYLIYANSESEMEVHWQLDYSGSCLLEWGVDTNYTSGNAVTFEYGVDNQHTHTITGLSSSTNYFYRVSSNGIQYKGSFLSPPSLNNGEVSFFVYGDHRTYTERHDSIAKAIADNFHDDPSSQTFIITTGDMIGNGNEEDDWDNELFATGFPNIREILGNLPYHAAMGNHEKDGILFEKYLPYPFPNGAGGEDGNYWSFDYGKAHITIIDQYTDYSTGSDQYDWLVNDLANTPAKWKILVLHAPGYASGHHPNDTVVQTVIQPLCETYDVQIVLGGHNHYYSRATVNDVVHITTAGGGADLYDPEDGFPFVDVAIKDYHFCKVSIQGNELRLCAINRDGDTLDDFSIYRHSTPFVLPFEETWEFNSGTKKTNGTMYIESNYGWSFETDRVNEGRARWGEDAYLSYEGIGALTMDKHPNNGTYAINSSVLTLDLSNYKGSDQLELSFWWTDHNDEDFAEDRVWVRGSDAGEWIEIYDLDPGLAPDGTYQFVSGLDIDHILLNADPIQMVSETFQLKFGQKDNSFAPGDGLSFDNISIFENTNKTTPLEFYPFNNTSPDNFKVYAYNDAVYIKSFGKSAEEKKEVFIYDLFGRTIMQKTLPPSALEKFYVGGCKCYLVVKVVSENGVMVKKVFVR